MNEDWTWRLVGKAKEDYRALEPSARTRLADKLDEVVENPWREQPDWTERLTGGPYDRLRVGDWRCAVSFDRDEWVVTVHRIEQPRDAWKGDDRSPSELTEFEAERRAYYGLRDWNYGGRVPLGSRRRRPETDNSNVRSIKPTY